MFHWVWKSSNLSREIFISGKRNSIRWWSEGLGRGTHVGFLHRLPSPDCFPLDCLVLLLLLLMTFIITLALLTFPHFLTNMLTRRLHWHFFFPSNHHNLTEVNATSVSICPPCLCQLASQLEVISLKCYL